MAKSLNVSMTFTADTSQAKKEMKSLQDQLSKLGKVDYGKGFGNQIVKDLSQAQKSVAELQVALRSAFNMDTGKLDFTKFNQSLKASGKQLSDYATTLKSLGPEGQEAFIQLSRAVSQAEIPVIRINNLFKSLGTTLANTARWQISSSVLHGFMGAIQSAYGYAQDLNRSLNDIRIVTGYSADEMAKFAEQANKSAQALSTTTTAYTDAALIFYQQGLSDEEVQKRTDATIKMANVTGENAEHVSSYMTAIWNNFADGSKSLEYYADVMTQLGAATAASSEEIAEGMEKFAAVGETVGLSYEYAAAAVTTVIDKTRQSADIVGTSFKTIFARLEGLQLGETLEDGTTLNKYSKALATVGINIKDQNGELKDMDQILDEMGAKWETLSKDQQVALAQTVGGVRQYTQLIALMDNFDAFRKNVQLGLDSEGTLQQQQNIYAESWEASTERVRAAWEALYSDIIKDDFFIELNNDLSEFLKNLDSFIDSLGGIKGLLLTLSPLINSIFGDKIAGLAKNAAYSLNMMVPGQRERLERQRESVVSQGLEESRKLYGENSSLYKIVQAESEYQKNMAKYSKDLNDSQKDILKILQDQKLERIKNLDLAEKEAEAAEKELKAAEAEAKTTMREAGASASTISATEKAIREYNIVYGAGAAPYRGEVKNAAEVGERASELNRYIQANAESFNAVYGKGTAEQAAEDYKIIQELQSVLKDEKITKEEENRKEEEIIEKWEAFAQKYLSVNEDPSGLVLNKAKEALKNQYKNTAAEEERASYIQKARKLGVKDIRSNLKEETVTKKINEEIAALDEDQKGRKKELKELLNEHIKTQKEINKESKKIEEASEEYATNIQQNAEDIAQQQSTVTEAKAKVSQLNKANENVKNPDKDTFEELVNQEAGAKAAEEAFNGLTKSLTSVASALTSLTSIANVWDQVSKGNITTGQALIQTTSMLAFGLNGLKSTYEGITAIKKSYAFLTQFLTSQTAKAIVAEAAHISVEEVETVTVSGLALAYSKLAAAKIAAFVTNPATIAITAAIGLLIAYKASIDSANKSLEEQIELNQKRIEKLSEQQKENKVIEDETKQINNLNEAYEKSVISKDEYADSLLNVANNLDIENASLLVQIGNYEEINKLIKEKIDLERQDAKESGEKIGKNIREGVLASAQKEADFWTADEAAGSISQGWLQYYAGYESDDLKKLTHLLDKQGLKYEAGEYALNFDVKNASDEDLKKYLEIIKDIYENSAAYEAKGYGDLVDFADEIIEGYGGIEKFNSSLEALSNSVDLLNQIDLDEAVENIDLSGFQENYRNIYDIINKTITENPDLDEDALRQATLERMSNIDAEMVGNYLSVESVLKRAGISMEEFFGLGRDDQNLIIEAAKNNSNGLISVLKASNGEIENQISAIQTSFDLINTTTAVEQVNNLVKAFDSIKSGDVKTNEEWAELLGEDFLEQFGEYFVETATGTMFVGSEQDKMQLQNNIQSRNYGKSKAEYDAEIEEERTRNKEAIKAINEQQTQTYYNNSILQSRFNSLELNDKTRDFLSGKTYQELGIRNFQDLQDTYGYTGTDIVELQKQKMLKNLISEEDYEKIASLFDISDLQAYDEELKTLAEDYDAFAFTVETSYADIKKQVSQYGTLVNREEGKVQVAIRRSAQEYGLAADEIVEYGKYLDENNKYLKDNAIMADAVALAYSRADKGLQDLNSNFETWNKALTDNTEDSKEYAEAMDGFETALQNIFNTEEDISNDFILEHMGDIQKAAEGDLEAITDLQIAFASVNAENAFAEAGKDLEQFKNELDTVDWSKIKIGDDIIDSDPILQKWFNTMNQMVAAGDMAASDMEAIWNSLGYELEPQTEYVDIDDATGITYMGMPASIKGLKTIKVKVVKGFKAKGSSYTGTNAAASKITNDNGGGKGSSSKGSKEKDYEKERYYTITRQIQDATDAFNEYEKAKDRAAGKAKVGYIDFEIENLKERQRLQKEYLKEIEDYYKQDQAKLNFFGATYDENGVLTNYDEIFNRLQQKYKDAVASGSEEAINAAQQDMDAFIAAANQFDKTNQLYQSEMIKDAELAREVIDKTIEKIDTTLTLKIEIDDRSLKMLEYQLGRIEGGAFTQGAQMANRQAQLNLQLDEQAATRKALDDLLKENKLTENDLATKTPEELVALGIDDKVIAKMKEYADKLLEIQGNIDALEETILGGALEAFEEFNAEFDYQSKIIEHQTKLLKSYKDIAELVYGNAGLDEGFMIDLMGTSLETMLARTAATRTKLEADRQALTKAREAFANYSGGDEKVQKQLEEDVRTMEETVMQGEEDLLSQTQENLQLAKEIFDRTLEAAKQDYLKAVGADDWSMTLFDRATKIDDQYLDDYEKIYHLAKLTRDVNNSIDDTPAFRGKERLREVTEEILELEKEGVKVSQYQVDALRAKYELRLAEIALEDSQNAKSTVRMARDNEGNWSYVYTSDADDVDKARQNYEDKLYEYQKLNTDYVKKQQKTYMDLAREAGDAIKQIADNSKLDPAVQDEMIAETEAYYAELMGITTSELELALGYNKDLYEKDWASYNKYTGYKISADQNYIDKFDETILGEITGLKSTQEAYQNWADALTGEGGFIPAVGNALDDLAEAQDRALENLGTDLDDFAGHVGAAMINAIDETENAKNAIEDNAKQMEEFFNDLVDAIKKLNDLRINDMREDTTNLINNLNLMIKAYNDLAEAKKKVNDVPSTGDKSGYDQSSLDNSGGNKNGGVKTGDEPYLKNNTITALNGYGGVDPIQNMLWKENNPATYSQLKSYLTSSTARLQNIDSVFVNGIRNAKNLKEFGDFLLKHGKLEDFKKFLRGNSGASDYGLPTIGFDTGGYTGSWGDSGRLAFLHQKELVLNAQDTANMLQMTNMVRELSEYIDFQAAATNLGRVSTTIGSVSALAGGELNQNVHIEATFPNVSEAYEIEEALTNLVNRAAQYANRR